MNTTNKLRVLHVFCHLMLVPAVMYGELWMWAAAYLYWYFVLGGLGVSMGFHSVLSHKVKVKQWFRNAIIPLGCLSLGGTPIGWAGAHRLHHQGPDTEKDPHSPKYIGFWRTYFHDWGHDVNIPRRLVADMIRDPVVMFCHKHYFKIVVATAAMMFLIHPMLGIFGFCIPAVLSFHGFALINTIGHKYGYRNYDLRDTSMNNWFVNLFTPGEGFHNNHHKNPRSHRKGERWFEFDYPAWFVETFRLIDGKHTRKTAN